MEYEIGKLICRYLDSMSPMLAWQSETLGSKRTYDHSNDINCLSWIKVAGKVGGLTSIRVINSTTLAILLRWDYSDWSGVPIKNMLSNLKLKGYQEGKRKRKSIEPDAIFELNFLIQVRIGWMGMLMY
ncbi:unnamed protein product [Haemonchus placei]|uniref:RNA-directed DNA polymerase, eukaryota, reverse transcriptase zinc-binding domain protein n=1 Tax=Haemonchus placei TaxID=6290 RepID=A0A0N4X1J5_HAEPC|nr:unnamed protein product [Haemonchus placei]